MTKNNKRPPEIKDILDRIRECKDDFELWRCWDLIDDLASANLITASQYIFLAGEWDDKLRRIKIQDRRRA